MNNLSENAAFDLMPLDQDVSYESYRLPPNSCLRWEEKLEYEPIGMVTLKHCVD